MTVVTIYDKGNVFSPSVLDIDEKTIIDQFLSGIKTIAAISLATNYPTIASVTHSLVNGYKNLVSIALVTDYMFEGAQKAKDYLENRSLHLHLPFFDSLRDVLTCCLLLDQPKHLLLLLPPLLPLRLLLLPLLLKSQNPRRMKMKISDLISSDVGFYFHSVFAIIS